MSYSSTPVPGLRWKVLVRLEGAAVAAVAVVDVADSAAVAPGALVAAEAGCEGRFLGCGAARYVHSWPWSLMRRGQD